MASLRKLHRRLLTWERYGQKTGWTPYRPRRASRRRTSGWWRTIGVYSREIDRLIDAGRYDRCASCGEVDCGGTRGYSDAWHETPQPPPIVDTPDIALYDPAQGGAR